MVLQISGNAESASPRFRAKCARPLSNVEAGSGNETSEVGLVANVVGARSSREGVELFHWGCPARDRIDP